MGHGGRQHFEPSCVQTILNKQMCKQQISTHACTRVVAPLLFLELRWSTTYSNWMFRLTRHMDYNQHVAHSVDQLDTSADTCVKKH